MPRLVLQFDDNAKHFESGMWHDDVFMVHVFFITRYTPSDMLKSPDRRRKEKEMETEYDLIYYARACCCGLPSLGTNFN